MATCSASELLESGKCFQCLTKKELQIVIAQLLCEISSGASGVTVNLTGSGSPVGVIVGEDGQFYTDTAGDALWQWYSGAWHQWI